MSKDIRIVNLIFAVAGLIISILGLIHIFIGRFIEKRVRAFFIALFLVLNVYVLTVLARELTYDHIGQGWVIFSRFLFFAQGMLAALITVIITAFLLDQCGVRDCKKNNMFRLSFGLWAVYAVLMIINLFTGILYIVDDNNVYNRGKYFPVLIILTVLIMLINLVILWQNRGKLSTLQKRAFSIFVTIPMISMIIQAFLFGINLIVLSSVIAALFALTYIIYDQTEKYYRIDAENEKLKTDIMLAQIQPHFLFNSLTAIKNLCLKDPEKANEGISQFTDYLRHNMDSLTMDRPIPFEEELDHVKAYLKLQKLRFGNDIDVEYSLEYTDFRLPTLTLQPLVENAIIHGVRKNKSGKGRIRISTIRVFGNVEISIKDDGPGFNYNEVSYDADRSHMGIQNVRNRIRNISGGELRIDSPSGCGTCVTIIIPAGEEKTSADICN